MTKLPTDLTLDSDAPIDLHMHTTYSDGRWHAQQLIDHLVDEGFALVSVTDHDRVDKVAEIQASGAEKGLAVLAGVEISTQWHGKAAHILCYGFDPARNELSALTEKVVRLQLENTYAVNEELRHQGYMFPRQEEILAQNNGKLHRPSDNITLLMQHGYVSSRREGLALIEKAGFYSVLADMGEAIDAAHKSGAVCLIAHPGRREAGFVFYSIDMLDQIRAEIPLDGIEVYHPYHSQETIEMYLEYVGKHELLQSTGSDSHSIPGRMPRKHRAGISEKLLVRLGITISSGTSQSK